LIRKLFKPIFLPYLTEKFDKEIVYNIKSPFEIKIIFEFEETFYDKIFQTFSILPAVKKLGYRKFKPEASMDRSGMNELVRTCSSELLLELVKKNKIFKNPNLATRIELINQNIYLKGSYLKFSREIGQSPWEIRGEKICHSSVEEEMTKTLKGIFSCDNCIMSAGGREDRDVRMLGSGRPFLIEIVNPRKRNK
jgi:tRNA pseudouridine synthase 10